MLIYLPHTKTKGLRGEFVDLFAFNNSPCCSVMALQLLKSLHEKNGTFNPKKTVFMFASGKFLTTAKTNKILENLLNDVCVQGVNKISCHSFRAGIPSTIGNIAKDFDSNDIKNFGRWRGNSYRLYTRLEKKTGSSCMKKFTMYLIIHANKYHTRKYCLF